MDKIKEISTEQTSDYVDKKKKSKNLKALHVDEVKRAIKKHKLENKVKRKYSKKEKNQRDKFEEKSKERWLHLLGGMREKRT